MPYIKQEARARLAKADVPLCAGELNYSITKQCSEYLRDLGTNYQRLNEIVGVLECAKLEFYRRMAAPYEDTKIKENGDVYQ